MPPARPPITGRPFQSASLTVSPKPSRSDFCSTTLAMRWNALICTEPTWWRFESRKMSRSPPRASSVCSHTRNPSGSSVAIDPASSELGVGHLLAHDAERLDDADRVLPRVETADLAHDRPVDVDAVLARELLAERQRELEVLHRERVDARWRGDDAVHLERRGHELGHRPHRRVVQLDEGSEELPHLRVRVGEVDVAAPDPLRVRPCARPVARGGSSTSRPAAGRAPRRSRSGRRRAARCRGPSRGRSSACAASTRRPRPATRCARSW